MRPGPHYGHQREDQVAGYPGQLGAGPRKPDTSSDTRDVRLGHNVPQSLCSLDLRSRVRAPVPQSGQNRRIIHGHVNAQTASFVVSELFVADHAEAALRTAVVIDRLVAERFGAELRIGIGINTGVVIAGTIGGGGKLEFTLIGDTVNVAARVEQLTKTTDDTILVTQPCLDALASRPTGLIDHGSHALKGKSAPVQVFSVEHL